MKKLLKQLILSIIISLIVNSISAQEVVVRPIESDEVLTNPGKGFTTFQSFNGDYGAYVPDCYSEPVFYKFDSTMQNKDHPQS